MSFTTIEFSTTLLLSYEITVCFNISAENFGTMEFLVFRTFEFFVVLIYFYILAENMGISYCLTFCRLCTYFEPSISISCVLVCFNFKFCNCKTFWNFYYRLSNFISFRAFDYSTTLLVKFEILVSFDVLAKHFVISYCLTFQLQTLKSLSTYFELWTSTSCVFDCFSFVLQLLVILEFAL